MVCGEIFCSLFANSLLLSSSSQIAHIAIDQLHCGVNKVPSCGQHFRGNQFLISGSDQMIQDFPARTARVAAKLGVI